MSLWRPRARSSPSCRNDEIEKVGVFVNQTLDHVRDTAKQAGLTAVQLHGDESTEFSRELFQELANGSGRPRFSAPGRQRFSTRLPNKPSNGIPSRLAWSSRMKLTKANAYTRFTSPKTETCSSKPMAFARA